MQLKAQLGIEKKNGHGAHSVNAGPAAPGSARLPDQETPSLGRLSTPARDRKADEEAALLNQARSGDPDAFSNLISGCLETLHRLVLRITKNHQDAEDVVQETIFKAHANLSRFEGRARFSTWISRIAINEALMNRRKHRHWKYVSLEDLTAADGLAVCSYDREQLQVNPEALYARQEIQERLLEAVRSLLPMYQAVYSLTRVRSCTIQETADELEISVAAVKARLHRASKQLREKLAPVCQTSPC